MNDNKNTAAQPLDLDKMEALARAVDDLPETTQPFVSMGGQVVIHTFSMSPEQVRAVANLYDAATPATIVALIALARRAPAPVAVALDKDAEKQRFIAWGQVFHRNARSYTARDFDHGLAAWLAAKADAVAQQSPAPVVAHDAPEARAYQPEGATGTTGAQDDLDYLLDYIPVPAARAEAKAKVADLRAQLAAKGQGAIFREIVQSIIGDGYLSETNMHRGRLALDRAAPASAQPDRGAALAEPVQVKIERQRVWIVKGNRSFMLAYVPDEGDDPAEMEAYANNLRSALSIFTPDVKSGVAAPSPASQPVAPEAAPTDLAKVGYFIREGAAWVATSSDDPRATILYRKTGAENAATTTVPDHSEREAAHAGSLADKVLNAAINVGHIINDEEVRLFRNPQLGGNALYQLDKRIGRALATIAAGQEAANTYTVDGVVMSALEYIDYLHDKLNQEASNAKDAARPIPDAECAQGSCARGKDGCRGRCCLAGHKLPIVADIDSAAMAAVGAAGQEGGE